MSIKGTGQEFELGIIPGVAWHTAISLIAGSKVKLTEGPLLHRQQEVIPDTTMGLDFHRRVDFGRINQDFSISGPVRYENSQWVHIIQALGAETGTVAIGVYTHQVDVESEIDGHFYTAAGIMRHSTLGSSKIHEWPSVKPIDWEISVGGDGFLEFKGNGIADTILETGDPLSELINTTDTIGTTSTTGSETLLIPYGHCRININDQDGADFNDSGAGTDRIFPINMNVKFARALERNFDSAMLTATAQKHAYKTSEPTAAESNKIDLLIDFEFAEWQDAISAGDADEWLRNFVSGQYKKTEIYFYNTAAIAFKMQFPNVIIENIDSTSSGHGKIPEKISLRALDCAVAPTGMTGITSPMRLTLINSWSKQYDDASAIT